MQSNATGKRSIAAMLGAVGALGLVASTSISANAQVVPGKGQVLKRLGPLPDLVTSMTAPTQINQGDTATVTVKIENVFEPGPPVIANTGKQSPGSPAVSGVSLSVRFTGFQVLSVQGDSGFNCQPAGGSGTVPNTSVQCSAGAIPAGAAATIRVTVKERGNPVHYCGPLYSDALVDGPNTIAERSETNNRAIAVTDTVGCIS